jgi:hypothetical protein
MRTVRMVQVTYTRHGRNSLPGSGYCEDQSVRLEQWTEWRLYGVLLWRTRRVVRELMPHEWISSATLGSET